MVSTASGGRELVLTHPMCLAAPVALTTSKSGLTLTGFVVAEPLSSRSSKPSTARKKKRSQVKLIVTNYGLNFCVHTFAMLKPHVLR
jgi:hypothetical protein